MIRMENSDIEKELISILRKNGHVIEEPKFSIINGTKLLHSRGRIYRGEYCPIISNIEDTLNKYVKDNKSFFEEYYIYESDVKIEYKEDHPITQCDCLHILILA